MALVAGPDRIIATGEVSATDGVVRWSPSKSSWIGGMTAVALILGPLTFSWPAFALFLVTTGITLCFGHSVGMHRRLIHGGFQCPLWLEHLLVYLGVMVGMAGPLGMTRIHDLRDWAQRQGDCHPFLRHGYGFWTDGWMQLHCKLHFDRPPAFAPEPRIADDRFYAFLERTWMLQQLPWALAFYALGGWSWVVWGVAMRVTVGVTGHWLVGHFAHRHGGQHWIVEGAAVQGHDVAIAGLISFGESWHNNHHAFPGSARLGLYPGQIDLGWAVIRGFEALGLAWDIVTPESLPARAALRWVAPADLPQAVRPLRPGALPS
jgi:stearoyl-CoA desaturase (delta-9 desaturase)